MLRTGSTPPTSPPWSAPDSIGYAVWNRLTRHDVPPSGAGITVSGNTSAIYDRHISFIDTLTARPPGLASTAPPRRADDMRVFRRAAVSAVAIVGQRWPIAISDTAIADSTRTGIPPQAATVIREEILAPSFTTSLAREVPPISQVSEAYARAVAPTTRLEPSVSIIAGVESRLVPQKTPPVVPLTTTNETVVLTADAMAYGPSALVSRSSTPAGVVRALSNDTGTLGRSPLVLRSPAGSASVPLSLPVAVDRSRALVPSLLTGAHAVVVREIATPMPGNSPVLVSRPTSAPLSTAMSFVPQSPLALARPISDAGLLQQTDVLSRMASPPLVNGALRSPGASASLNHSIAYPSIARHIEYTQAAFSQRSVNRLPNDANISVRPITRKHDTERRVIDTAVSFYDRSKTPASPPAETGILQLPSRPIVMRRAERARVTASSVSIPLLSGLLVSPLELWDRLDFKPQQGALWTAPQEIGVGPAQIAISERSIDSPVGLSPEAPGTIPLPGIEPMVRRAEADFAPAVLARANMSPIPPLADLRVTPSEIFASSTSDGGLATSSRTAPSLPPALQSPSAGPSPLDQTHRVSGYLKHGALRIASQDVPVARAKLPHSETSVDLPVGLSRALSSDSPSPRIQLMALRAKGVDGVAFLLTDVVRSPTAPPRQAELPMISQSLIAATRGVGPSMMSTSSASRLADTTWPHTGPLTDVIRSPAAQLRHVGSGWSIAAARGADEPMRFTPAQPQFADTTWPFTGSPADVARSPVAALRQARPPAMSDSFIAAPGGVGESIMLTSGQPRSASTAWPLTGSLTDVVRSPTAQLRQAEPPVISDSFIAAPGGVGESIMLTSGKSRSASTAWPPTGPLTDVVRSPTAQLRQAEPRVISDPFIAAAGGIGQSMMLTSVQPQSASMAWPLTGPLTDVVRSQTAQLRQAEPPAIPDSLIAATGDVGESMMLTSVQPQFAGTAWPLTAPRTDVVRSPTARLRQAEAPGISDSPIAATPDAGELMISTPDQSRVAGTKWPLARSVSLPQVIGDHSSGGGMIFFDLPGQSVVNGPLTHRAFDDRGSSFPSGSYNGFSTERRRSDLPLRVASRRYDAATPSVRSSAAAAQVFVPTSVAVARAESPGSALYDPAASAVVPDSGIPLDVGPRSDTSLSAPSPDSEADADDIIERAWREVMSRLAIEQERRGYGRWS